MAKKEKLLEKISVSPKNVAMGDLLRLMKAYGFEAKRNPHGYIFLHPDLKEEALQPYAAEPNGTNNKVLVTYVRKCLAAIELLEP